MSIHTEFLTYEELYDDNKESVFIHKLLDKYGVEAVLEEIEYLLTNAEEKTLHTALRFIRQASLFRKDNELLNLAVTRFRKNLPHSQVFSLLNQLLFSSAPSFRRDAIYTFGKIGFSENISRLEQARDWFVLNHSDELEKLDFELTWLKDTENSSKNPTPLPPAEW